MLPDLPTGSLTMKSYIAIIAGRNSMLSCRSTTVVPAAKASVMSVPMSAELSLPVVGTILSESALTAIKNLVIFNTIHLFWVSRNTLASQG